MNTDTIISSSQIDTIKQHSEVLSFSTDFDLTYPKQFLPGVILLISGEIQYLKKHVEKSFKQPGRLIGLQFISNNKKSIYQVRVKAGSEIILIGRSDLSLLTSVLKSVNHQ